MAPTAFSLSLGFHFPLQIQPLLILTYLVLDKSETKVFLVFWYNIRIFDTYTQGVHKKLWFVPGVLGSLPPLPRQHSAAIGCTKKLPANRSVCTLVLR